METVEKFLAGRAYLASSRGSATAKVRELLRPETPAEDPTTEKGVEHALILPYLFVHHFATIDVDLADRMTVALEKLHATSAVVREAAQDWSVFHRPAASSAFYDYYTVQTGAGFGVQTGVPATPTKRDLVFLGGALATGHDLLAHTLALAEPMSRKGRDWVQLVGLWSADAFEGAEPVSPFDQLASLSYARIASLIENIGKIYQVRYAATLSARLADLVAGWQEEHEIGDAPSTESLSGLLRFLSSDSAVRIPAIVLSPNGTWVAEWRLDSRNLFSAHFLDEANARFVAVAALGKSSRQKPNQVWGEIETAKLLATAQTYGADRWMRE